MAAWLLEDEGQAVSTVVSGRVGDAITQMTSFACERKDSGGIDVKVSTERHERSDSLRPFRHQHPGNINVTQACARHERVVKMLIGGVIIGERRCDATLCPSCRSLLDAGFGDEQDTATGAACVQCRGQAGYA